MELDYLGYWQFHMSYFNSSGATLPFPHHDLLILSQNLLDPSSLLKSVMSSRTPEGQRKMCLSSWSQNNHSWFKPRCITKKKSEYLQPQHCNSHIQDFWTKLKDHDLSRVFELALKKYPWLLKRICFKHVNWPYFLWVFVWGKFPSCKYLQKTNVGPTTLFGWSETRNASHTELNYFCRQKEVLTSYLLFGWIL